ncbi:1-phosphofructokinase, partial [Paenibacillus macerans]|nr:1-phosphofructokinase [Paenibacillus macerans]
MITTVTLHAAIDRTYYVDEFSLGQVHRVARQVDEPGGKGNNVAKVGIETAFVHAPGESRVCLNILDESSGSSTELLGPGPAITEPQIAAIKETRHSLAQKSSIVVLSGSLPAGAPENMYAELINIGRS